MVVMRIVRVLSIAVLFCIALGGTGLAALTYPQPPFSHSAVHGRLSLYSDRPFDPALASNLLGEVERRLARSSLNDANVHRIFITNSDWRRRVMFLWNVVIRQRAGWREEAEAILIAHLSGGKL